MSRRRRRLAALLVGMAAGLAVGLVGARIGWLARPMPTVREVQVMYDGRLRVQETRRERRLLPVDQWGTESGAEIGCGSKKSISSRCRTFGFFEVVDVHESWLEPAPQAPPGP